MTIRTVLDLPVPDGGFTWTDVVQPTPAELDAMVRRYGLHQVSVNDCLDPEHLPKLERFPANTFLIVRAFDESAGGDAMSVQDITRKVAIFYGPKFLVTIHRKEQPYLTEVVRRHTTPPPAGGAKAERREHPMPRLLIDILNAAIDTYDKPLEDAENQIDPFEATLFSRGDGNLAVLLRQIYLVKRRVTMIKRMLLHTLGVVKQLTPPPSEPGAPFFQDLKENAESTHFYSDELTEDINNLLAIEIALASHRTNEVVRVLTVFSVFFLPLTFIVGVYGMNFAFMPELRQRWGYPAVIGFMALVTLATFLWFRRRGWLRG